MKTIEERATERYPITAENMDKALAMRRLYVKIATEQRAIDIENAIDVIENLPQDFSRQMIIDALIKAMEE